MKLNKAKATIDQSEKLDVACEVAGFYVLVDLCKQ